MRRFNIVKSCHGPGVRGNIAQSRDGRRRMGKRSDTHLFLSSRDFTHFRVLITHIFLDLASHQEHDIDGDGLAAS
jgi:hypothetical protein